MLQDGPLSDYEKQRLENVARNAAVMASLGLDEKFIPKKKVMVRQKKRPRTATRELSRRVRQMPTPVYTPRYDEAADTRKAEVKQGLRMPDGTWSGERFGEVSGYPAGTTFGFGDFQRLGRQEMMESGFFRPFVTPEWIAPGEGCYAIILNNDNGASSDEGDVIRYAGSGGRQRGQNRTAPQSFDQDWKNATNAALRFNNETGKPVRVIRGPKLRGAHGTGNSGGGYRYDGLFRVSAAELVRLPGSKMRTAMFTLVRVETK
jgi:E3 ubiquitin-protein ligase UHRF1